MKTLNRSSKKQQSLAFCAPLHTLTLTHSMFFKLNSFYRQFSYCSLRLLGKKLINTTTSNSFQLTGNSPLKTNKVRKFSLKGIPSPFGIEHSRQQLRNLNLIYKRRYCTTNWHGIITSTSTSKNNLKNGKNPIRGGNENLMTVESLDKIFPLLTGEELKAFDSSVFEF